MGLFLSFGSIFGFTLLTNGGIFWDWLLGLNFDGILGLLGLSFDGILGRL